MPRYDDDDDDRPRRRRPRDDDDDDDAPRSRRRPVDDDEDDAPRPRRRGRDLRDDDDFGPPPKKKSRLGLTLAILGVAFVFCCGGGGFAVYYFFDSFVGEKRSQRDSSYNLRQIGLALHNYHDINNGLPKNTVDANNRPLLSWRVHLLPYLNEQGLYNQFKLNEPWDSPNNRRLLDQMPRVYASPAEQQGKVPQGNKTYYRGFSHPGAVFAPRGGPGFPNFGPGGPPAGFQPPAVGLRMVEVTDGTSNTIAVVEAGDPVEWTKPDDLDASPGKPFPKLGGVRPKSDEFLVLMLDGSFRIVRRTASEMNLRAATTAQGGEVVVLD